MVFDLLPRRTRPGPEPLEVRRAALESLEIDGSGGAPAVRRRRDAFEATLQQGLEGVVSKRRTSVHCFGERTPTGSAARTGTGLLRGGRLAAAGGTTDRLAALLVGS